MLRMDLIEIKHHTLMNEEEIIKSLCASEAEQRAAVKYLLDSKGKAFKYRFKRKGVHEDYCDDLVQEVMLKIIKGAKQYTGINSNTDNSAAVWMNSIAQNCMNDYFRTNNKTIKLHSTELKIKIGSLDDENWMKSGSSTTNQQTMGDLINKKAQENYTNQCERDTEIEIEECIKDAFDDFEMVEPSRAYALTMQMDGESIESIGRRIGKSTRAATEYLSQCRKKIKPYLERCNNLK